MDGSKRQLCGKLCRYYDENQYGIIRCLSPGKCDVNYSDLIIQSRARKAAEEIVSKLVFSEMICPKTGRKDTRNPELCDTVCQDKCSDVYADYIEMVIARHFAEVEE